MDSYDVLSLICPMTSGSATHFLITGQRPYVDHSKENVELALSILIKGQWPPENQVMVAGIALNTSVILDPT